MIRLLHISDVHLGAPLGGFGPAADERRRAIRDAFRRLPARAEAWDVHAVLVAGDLFDAPEPEPADVDLAREVLRRLAADRPVFAIPGNHDPAVGDGSPWRDMPPAVTPILAPRFGAPHGVTVAGDVPLHVYGLAYDPTVEPDPLAGFRRAADPGLHVVLLHAATADNPDWSGGQSLRVSRGDLAALDADYVALGDYHGFRPPADFGGLPACYPGSFAAVAVDEVGLHGCAVVELEADAPPRVRLEPTDVPRLVDLGPIDVSSAEDDRAVEALIAARCESDAALPVAELVGAPSFPLDAERVRDALRERYGFAVVRDRTRFIDSEHVERLAERPTIAGHVARIGRDRVASAADAEQREVAARALRLALRALDTA